MASDDTNDKKGFDINLIVSRFSIIAALICVFIYLVENKLGWSIDGVTILLFLMTSISLFIISSGIKNEDANKKLDKIYQDFTTITNDTVGKVDRISKNVDIITNDTVGKVDKIYKDMEIYKTTTPALIGLFQNQHEFYCSLEHVVTNSTERVWITHLDQWSPYSPQYKDNDRSHYFDEYLKFVKANPNIKFKRIMSIPTSDKFEWVERFINDVSQCDNLNIAYIRIDDIEHSIPFSVFSCQIIDDDKMFLLNPLLNRVPRDRPKFHNFLYFENENIVSVFAEYYEMLWNKIIEENYEGGCILKDGAGTQAFTQNRDKILRHIQEIEKNNEQRKKQNFGPNHFESGTDKKSNGVTT